MAACEEAQDVASLQKILLDTKQPMPERMRAVFFLRTNGGEGAAAALATALADKKGSCLFRHEIAYCLGQMRLASADEHLAAILRDTSDDSIVRHECAEALAAIGSADSLPILEEFCKDEAKEVSETCQIAVPAVRWRLEHGEEAQSRCDAANPYQSIDPAPLPEADLGTSGTGSAPPTAAPVPAESSAKPATSGPSGASKSAEESSSVEELGAQLLDEDRPLFERYRAMFALRNRGGAAAVGALCRGMLEGSSALFRHECAYVLGQMAAPEAESQLAECLSKAEEHPMVRHEAAEALGAVGTKGALETLRTFMKDPEQVVRESCEVALDAADYWKEGGEAGASEEGKDEAEDEAEGKGEEEAVVDRAAHAVAS